ncbi:hypothetical protein RF11_10104 [Thelohanellus kitauei]|uniref:Uncharacterized protein n=1 Tax=Thelohanellus kitauei TaxID=669202 RepID=A0A0C2I994_THEKT|nr:hypothetical protein RF11_10104 [Thelohanellus kitauei]
MNYPSENTKEKKVKEKEPSGSDLTEGQSSCPSQPKDPIPNDCPRIPFDPTYRVFPYPSMAPIPPYTPKVGFYHLRSYRFNSPGRLTETYQNIFHNQDSFFKPPTFQTSIFNIFNYQ